MKPRIQAWFFSLCAILAAKTYATEYLPSPNPTSTVSHQPFDLRGLIRVDPNRKIMDKPIRTSPLFFENALGIHPGNDHFWMPNTRWKRLQSSELFHNLTAQPITNTVDNTVRVKISGQELPSRVFTPEVSASMHGDNPVVDGTVRFVDKNFNGLGQRLSLSLSAREEIDADKIDASSTKLLEELNTDPIHECTWEDWSIDGESISVGIKRDYARDMRYRLSKRSSLVGGVTVKTIVDSAFAKWTSQLFSSARTSASWGLKVFGKRLQGYNKNNLFSPNTITGAKLEMQFKNSMDSSALPGASVWCETGNSFQHKAVHSFHRVGASFFKRFSLAGRAPSISSGNDSTDILVQLQGRRAWGGGIVPHFHHLDLGSSNTVRGHRPPTTAHLGQNNQTALMGDDSARSFVATKLDVLFHSWRRHRITPGVFMDCALYNSDRSDQMNSIRQPLPTTALGRLCSNYVPFKAGTVTMGPSFRFQGFKMELSIRLNAVHDYFKGLAKFPFPSLHLGVDICN